MDIGIDTIIYIVLGLIFVLSQVARKKKPVKPPQPEVVERAQAEEPEKETEAVSSLWQQFWNDEEESVTPELKPQTAAVVPPVKDIVADDDEDTTMSDPMYTMEIQEETDTEGFDKDDLTRSSMPQPDDADYSVDFDLRSAVIYSAILERKYV